MEKKPSSSDPRKVYLEQIMKNVNILVGYAKPMYGCLEGTERTSKEVAVAVKEVAADVKELLEVEKKQLELGEKNFEISKENSEVFKDIRAALLEKSSEEVPIKRKRPRRASPENNVSPRHPQASQGCHPQECLPQPSPCMQASRPAARRPQPQGKCLACENTHKFEQCNVYSNYVTRRDVLMKKNLCTHCAYVKAHCSPRNQDCKLKNRPCQHCRDIHMNALCPVKYPVKPSGNA